MSDYPLHYRLFVDAFWWHIRRGETFGPELWAELVESDRRIQAHDARLRYRRQRRSR